MNGPTIAVVGGGRRTQLLLRVAAAAGERLPVTGVVTRRAEVGDRLTAQWGVPTFRTLDDLLAVGRPDLVVVAVPWPASPEVLRDVAARGLPVLGETPPAPDLDGLTALWADVGASGLVQVAEQYLLMPGHAARLAVVREGVIGEPTSVEVASTHLYHAVSMIRGFLGVGLDDVVVSGRDFSAPLVDPLGFDGWVPDARPEPRTTTLATLDYGGRHGVYDFVENQWWNPLRARRLVIRGSLGEVVDDEVTRLVGPTTPVTSPLSYRRTGIDMNLEGNDLVHVAFDGRVVYENPWVGSRLSEDDVGVASMLAAALAWARDEGAAPYPLAEACEDHAISLAIQESARTRQDVRVSGMPWAR
ncbi:Gfo/Idh/MocA family protein [Actinotalea sp. Marseille-Q4924]|uniref:Gfo/Idh/MocA family protein n=1 Tax=Actinotalea sp. Marseille-Q4924 TaxID=2866571 RepID=UPI001CE4AB40|nr:Gfo/Idh/MocA family oxidoreductase [Actinotalea sp. Marseille-Q4924]